MAKNRQSLLNLEDDGFDSSEETKKDHFWRSKSMKRVKRQSLILAESSKNIHPVSLQYIRPPNPIVSLYHNPNAPSSPSTPILMETFPTPTIQRRKSRPPVPKRDLQRPDLPPLAAPSPKEVFTKQEEPQRPSHPPSPPPSPKAVAVEPEKPELCPVRPAPPPPTSPPSPSPGVQSFLFHLFFDATETQMNDERRALKCVLVGEAAVGKTSLIVSYSRDGFSDEYKPTAFDNYSVVVRVDKKPIGVQLCDTAGQKSLDSIRPLSYPDCDVFIIVFSTVDQHSFRMVTERWLPELMRANENTPIILCGSQIDKRWQAHASTVISTAKGKQLQKQIRAVNFFETSSLTKDNVKLMFDAAILAGLEGKKTANTKKSKIREGFQKFMKKVF